jgi:hypothetical protein
MSNAPELDRLIFRLREAMLPTKRFVKLNADKKPIGESSEWPINPWGIDELEGWPYWGVAGREGLILIDCDIKELEDHIRTALPQTFEALSVRRKGAHFYFKVEGEPVPNMTLKLDGKAAGEVRANNHYLVAPGTEIDFIDKDGNRVKGRYTIKNDVPIAKLSHDAFMTAIKLFIDEESERGLTHEKIEKGVDVGERHETAHRLATFLIGIQRLDSESALVVLRQWNQAKCRPPIDDKDLVRSIKNAASYIRRTQRPAKESNSNVANAGVDSRLIEKMETTDMFDTLVAFLAKTVKNDPRYIHNVLMCGFSAYTPAPINCASEAPTSEGKTYGFTEVLRIFPDKDVLLMGGMSPKALIHRRARLYDEDGNDLTIVLNKISAELAELKSVKGKAKDDTAIEAKKRELSELYNKGKWIINLENTIMVFLEAPSLETFMMLRPLLSHDSFKTEYDFVEPTTLSTRKIYLRGWPLVFWAKAGRGKEDIIWSELKSRAILITPAMDTTKYRSAIDLLAQRRGLPGQVADAVIGIQSEDEIKRMVALIKQRLADISKAAKAKGGKPNPNVFWIPYYREAGSEFPANVGKNMRDADRFFSMINMSAAINIYARPTVEIDGVEYVVAIPVDYDRAKKIFFEETGAEIFTGVPSHVLKLFRETIVPLCAGTIKIGDDKQQTFDSVTLLPKEQWRDVKTRTIVEHSKISGNTLRQHYLPLLEDAGLLTNYPDPEDKRGRVWHIMKLSLDNENIPKNTLFGDKGLFTLETLKERLNELDENAPTKCKVHLNDISREDKPASIEELYSTYYCTPPIPTIRGCILIPPAEPPIDETTQKIPPDTQSGVNWYNTTVTLSRPAQPVQATGAQAQPEPQALLPELSQNYTIKYLTGLASGTQASKAHIEAALGVSHSCLQAAIDHLEQRGRGIIDRGASIEVL